MPLLGCFGIASLADRATEDGVEGVIILHSDWSVDMTKQELKRIFCARQEMCRMVLLYMGKAKEVGPSTKS